MERRGNKIRGRYGRTHVRWVPYVQMGSSKAQRSPSGATPASGLLPSTRVCGGGRVSCRSNLFARQLQRTINTHKAHPESAASKRKNQDPWTVVSISATPAQLQPFCCLQCFSDLQGPQSAPTRQEDAAARSSTRQYSGRQNMNVVPRLCHRLSAHLPKPPSGG